MDCLLLIVRHGPAEPAGSEGDAARRLTREGRERMRRAAAALVELAPKPDQIWSSPLVRARETAALLAEAFGVAEATPTPFLAHGFDRGELVVELERAGSGPYVVVGHEPDVSALTAWLLGAGARSRIKFGSGTSALVSFTSPGAGILHALYPLEAFAPPGSG
ncbi:MAG: SixA phosphatase family protein [Gammaproteobacteria bacterium]